MTAETAAAMLGTNTTMLTLWEERFGFPVPVGSREGQPIYPDETMMALRDALSRKLSIAGAITEARRVRRIRRQNAGPTTTRGGFSARRGTQEEAR